MRTFLTSPGNDFPLTRLLLSLTAALAALLVTGCGDDGGDGASLRVLVTDAPSDYVESAEMWVSAVYLQGGSGADDDLDDDGIDDGEDEEVSGRVFLFEDEDDPIRFDLLELRAGIMEDLTGEVDIEPGTYGQLRLVVDSAFVTLKPGFQFEDGSQTMALKVPSGSTSGVKVQLDGPIGADEGEEITIVVDIDVDRNFVMQGNPDSPAGIRGMIFTPTLRELSRDETEDDGP